MTALRQLGLFDDTTPTPRAVKSPRLKSLCWRCNDLTAETVNEYLAFHQWQPGQTISGTCPKCGARFVLSPEVQP
jgi:hypothetical protein